MIASYNYSNKVASATVKAGPGVLHSVSLAAGADAATAIFYDNTAASGTIIIKLAAVIGGTESAVLDVAFGTGLHVAVTGTAPSFTASYA